MRKQTRIALTVWTLSAAALLGLGSRPASATVGFEVPSAVLTLNPYEEFTFDIRITSSGDPGVLAVNAAVWGYNPANTEFVRGEAVSGFLYDDCVPGTGCFSGIDNMEAGTLEETTNIPGVGPFVRFATGNSLGARTATGANDPGLDGSTSDAQFRLTFRMTGLGITQFTFGTMPDPAADLFVTYADTGGARGQSDIRTVNATVVPEPGTALLLALGLAALSAGRRRAAGPR